MKTILILIPVIKWAFYGTVFSFGLFSLIVALLIFGVLKLIMKFSDSEEEKESEILQNFFKGDCEEHFRTEVHPTWNFLKEPMLKFIEDRW